MNDQSSIAAAITKAASAWAAVGITSWSSLASFLASCYTLVLIGEWIWKRLLREWVKKHREAKHGDAS